MTCTTSSNTQRVPQGLHLVFLWGPQQDPKVTDNNIVATFQKGILDKLLIGKISRKPPKKVMQLFETANSYAKSANAINASREEKQWGSHWHPKKDNGNNNNN